MRPLLKKAVVAVAAKQVFDKVREKQEESKRSTRMRFVPLALAGVAVGAFFVYRARSGE